MTEKATLEEQIKFAAEFACDIRLTTRAQMCAYEIEKSLRLVPKLIALREVAKKLFDEWFEREGCPPTATWERLEAAIAALDAGEGV